MHFYKIKKLVYICTDTILKWHLWIFFYHFFNISCKGSRVHTAKTLNKTITCLEKCLNPNYELLAYVTLFFINNDIKFTRQTFYLVPLYLSHHNRFSPKFSRIKQWLTVLTERDFRLGRPI